MKYLVKIEETLVYEIEVEANSEKEAVDMAYNHEKFTHNISDENDSEVVDVEVLED